MLSDPQSSPRDLKILEVLDRVEEPFADSSGVVLDHGIFAQDGGFMLEGIR